MSQHLENLYIARLTTQDRPCFICSKFTTVVLTLADNSNADWFYICRSHLGDHNFCHRIGGSPKSPKSATKKAPKLEDRPPETDTVSDLVATIGSAWNSWRNKGSDTKNDKETKDGKDSKDEKDEKDDKKQEKQGKNDSAPGSPSASTSDTSATSKPSPPSSPPQEPIRFVLQRDYFYLRQREYTRKIQKKEAERRLQGLQFPQVPKTSPM